MKGNGDKQLSFTASVVLQHRHPSHQPQVMDGLVKQGALTHEEFYINSDENFVEF